MILLKELCHHLDTLLEAQSFKDYCINGLQIEGRSEISKIAVAVSANLETIQSAVEKNVQALIVHHGMFWQSDSHAIKGVKREKLALLLKHNISLLAYHLPLDAHPQFGNNWKAARDLKWNQLEPFGLANGVPIGVKGQFSPIHRDEFKHLLQDYYHHQAFWAPGGKEMIRSAALISGGAYRNMQEAIEQDVDCFITGNFDEPAWNQAFEEKINFFALGHTATERIGPQALGTHIAQKYGIEVIFIDTENPF